MNFQLTYFKLEDYIRSILSKEDMASVSYYTSLSRLNTFLSDLEPILQQETLAAQLEPAFPTAPNAAILTKLVGTYREKARNSLSILLNTTPHYNQLFTMLSAILAQDKSEKNTDIKDLVKFFHDALNFKIPTTMLADVLSKSFNSKLKESKAAGNLEYDKSHVVLRDQVFFVQCLRSDTALKALAANDEYVFSDTDLNKLNKTQYVLIKAYPISQIFLLAGFGVTELDPPEMKKTILATQHFNPHDIDTLIKLAESTKRNLGLDKFKELLSICYGNSALDLSKLPAILNAANTIGNKAPLTYAQFMGILRQNRSWESISNELPDLYCRSLEESCDPIPNDVVYASYKTTSADVIPAFMPSDEALAISIQHFEDVDKLSKLLLGSTETELKSKLDDAVRAYKLASSATEKKIHEPIIWAILREQFRLSYGIFLYNTQMINAHLILNSPNQKTIAQIKTGEGKSALQVIMMAFRALTTDKKQFNVTTANHLAERDVDKFKSFYNKLGLSCTSNVSSNPKHSNLYSKPESYSGNIVYGTANAFQFGYMTAMDTDGSELRELIQPQKTDIYIDEVDALVIDKEKSTAQIAKIVGSMDPYDRTGKYHHIWNYIWDNRATDTQPATYSLDGLKAHLISKKFFTEESIDLEENKFQTYHWYQSALTALNLENKRDYVIRPDPNMNGNNCVVIVDRKGTGSLMHGSRWKHGLQQIISARENVLVPKESLTKATTSQRSFFNLFPCMFAVTGTTGGVSCEDYLKWMYPGVSILNMPRYRVSKAAPITHLVSDDKAAQYNQLIDDIVMAREKGQPLLFLFETIRETREFQAYALSRGHTISILTGDEDTSIDNTIALAGLPGSILAATFLAGRGADITPSPEAEANGGLGVFVCTPPINERVIWQNFGRTGRQGRQGFFAFRFSRDELLLKISSIEKSILSNRWYKEADSELLEISERNWEMPYTRPIYNALSKSSPKSAEAEAVIAESKTEGPVPAIAEAPSKRADEVIEKLKIENKVKEATKVVLLEKRNASIDNNALLTRWEKLKLEGETLENLAGTKYARYTDIVFDLQRLVYDTQNPKFISMLLNAYGMILDNIDDAFKERKLIAFEHIIGKTLIKMGQGANLDIDALQTLATNTNNFTMTRCLQHTQTVEKKLEQNPFLTQLFESTKKNIDAEKFEELLTVAKERNKYYQINFPTILNAANTIGNKAPITMSYFINMLRQGLPWSSISNELQDIYARAAQESYAPIPNKDVYASYKIASNDVDPAFMPSDEALAISTQHFEEVDRLSQLLFGIEELDLKNKLNEVMAAYKIALLPEDKKRFEPMIWALLREQFRQTYGIFLYSTQMINAHLILNSPNKKTIAQIKTGEGKSALQTIMMAFRALTTDKKQFNITTAAHLAERDVAKFTPFYEKLGLSCSINVSSDASHHGLFAQPMSYSGHIVYGTAESFQFGYLSAMEPGTKNRKLRDVINPKETDIYVDEVDALVIDREKSISRLQENISSVDSHNQVGKYHHIWQYIWDNKATQHKPATSTLNGLRSYLIDKGYFTNESMALRENLFTTYHWYYSALSALHIEKGRDYVIKPNPNKKDELCVVIVDRQGTGSLMHGTVWGHGLHQIISAREEVPIQEEAGIKSAISQSSFLNLFENMFAVTGTTGGTSCEGYLKNMYPGVSIMNMPRYRDSKAALSAPCISDNKKAQYDQLIADIKIAREKGQPLLFLFETIRETKEFQAYASSMGHDISILTGDEDTSIENIIALAGLPGSILAATFLAGRGADITPSPEAEANGGLGVFVCSPPINERVIWQNFGRTGRQGRDGFFAFRFTRDELLIKINQFEQQIARNSQYAEPDSDVLDLPEQVWDKPYEPDDLPQQVDQSTENSMKVDNVLTPMAPETDLNATPDAPIDLVDALKRENLAQQATIALSLQQHYGALNDDELLQRWKKLRRKAEHFENIAGSNYARYTHVIYSLQKIIYDLSDCFPEERRFISALTDQYQLIMDDLSTSFKKRRLIAFEKHIGKTLKDMSNAIFLKDEDLLEIAEKTNNQVILRCLKHLQTPSIIVTPPLETLAEETTSNPHLFFAQKQLGVPKVNHQQGLTRKHPSSMS